MPDENSEAELVAQAIAGDRIALQRLLVRHSRNLQRHVASKMPQSLQSSLGLDDVVQQVLIRVYENIDKFEPRSDGSFWRWLKTIANNQLQDAIRLEQRQKRGGGLRKTNLVVNQSGSIEDLVNLLSAGSGSPSKSVARHDAVRAVQESIEQLPEDYRQAVQYRFFEGRSLEEVAEIMDRTPRAVQGLIDRAKKKMRAALGRLSLYQ